MATFEPGVSGNPSGRPKGTINKNTQLAKLLEPHAEGLINKTVELALSGDTTALRLCIKRLIPRATEKPVTIVMPELTTVPCSKILPELLGLLTGHELTLADVKAVDPKCPRNWERPRFSKSNGITEGFHRKMKLIQRRAYGFRNFENYRVRVRVLCC